MKTRRTLLAALLLATTFGAWSRTSDAGADTTIAVIVNKGSPTSVLGASELRPIFQTTKTSLGAGDVTPLNLPSESKLRQEFDQAVLGLDPDRAARYWKDRKIRGGARAPKQLPSTAAVLAAVGADPSAIGYISLGEVSRSVKVVAKISGGKLAPP